MCGGGGGGGYLLISIAEIRYRHDLVRLCHKFYFCGFRMKIPHIDEDRAVCVTYPGLCLGVFVSLIFTHGTHRNVRNR